MQPQPPPPPGGVAQEPPTAGQPPPPPGGVAQDPSTELKQQIRDLLSPFIETILNKKNLRNFPKTIVEDVIKVVLEHDDTLAVLRAIQKGDEAAKTLLESIMDGVDGADNKPCFHPTRVMCYTSFNNKISEAEYISLDKATRLMQDNAVFCIMAAFLILLHYPVNRKTAHQERNRHGVDLSYTFRQLENNVGHYCQAILQAYVELFSLQNVLVYFILPLPDGAPDARNPVLTKENPDAVAHFSQLIQLRLNHLMPIFPLCHIVVKSAPVWDELMNDFKTRGVTLKTVLMRELGLRARITRANDGGGYNSAFTLHSFPIVKVTGDDTCCLKNKHPSHQWAQKNEFVFETLGLAALVKFPTTQGYFYNVLFPLISSYLDDRDESISEILLHLRNNKALVCKIVKELLSTELKIN